MTSTKNIPKNKHQLEEADWVWSHFEKSLNPLAANEAHLAFSHLFCARQRAQAKDNESAYDHYKQAMLLLFQADETEPGKWTEALVKINSEYGHTILHG